MGSSLKSFPKNNRSIITFIFGRGYLTDWGNCLDDTSTIDELNLKWHYHPIDQLYISYLVLRTNTAYSAGIHYSGLCGRAKYMQSILQFFIITVAAYPKGKLSTKDSHQILSLPTDIYLYILATILFPYDTFLYDMHTRKYHFYTAIKICFCEPPTFCWLGSISPERRLNQNGWILRIERPALLSNFFPTK